MVSKKGKRRIVVEGGTYYWYVHVTENSHRVIILTEDKKLRIEVPFCDTEESITPQRVAEIIRSRRADN